MNSMNKTKIKVLSSTFRMNNETVSEFSLIEQNKPDSHSQQHICVPVFNELLCVQKYSNPERESVRD